MKTLIPFTTSILLAFSVPALAQDANRPSAVKITVEVGQNQNKSVSESSQTNEYLLRNQIFKKGDYGIGGGTTKPVPHFKSDASLSVSHHSDAQNSATVAPSPLLGKGNRL